MNNALAAGHHICVARAQHSPFPGYLDNAAVSRPVSLSGTCAEEVYACIGQMPMFTQQEQPAIKHLAFEGEEVGVACGQGEGASDISPSALPYLNVSPHSMPAAALLASPSGTAPLGSTSLMTNPHPGFIPHF